MIRHALIGGRGSPPLQLHTLLRSEDSASTCDIIVSDCAHECGRHRGSEEQIGFMSDLLLIDKDDGYSRRHGGPDSDVNTVNCYSLTVLLF